MQPSMLEQFETTREKELAPSGLGPVLGTELDGAPLYFLPPDVELGQTVNINILHRKQKHHTTRKMVKGRVEIILPNGRVVIQGISEGGLYNRVFVSCAECAAGRKGDNTCKEVTYSGCFSEPLER